MKYIKTFEEFIEAIMQDKDVRVSGKYGAYPTNLNKDMTLRELHHNFKCCKYTIAPPAPTYRYPDHMEDLFHLSQNETLEYQNNKAEWEKLGCLSTYPSSYIFKLFRETKIRIRIDSED